MYRLLVVDEEDKIREVLKEYAEQMGMQEGKDFIVNKFYNKKSNLLKFE